MNLIKSLLSALAVAVLIPQLVAGPALAADPSSASNRNIWSVDTGGLAYQNGLLLNHGSPCTNGFDTCSADAGLTVVNDLAPCEPQSVIACIASVEASTDGTNWVPGVYQGARAASWPYYAFPAHPELGIGAANQSNLYTFDGISHDQGNLFEVNPWMQAEIQTGQPISITQISTKVTGVVNDPVPNVAFTQHVVGQSGAEWLATMSNCLVDFTQSTTCWRTTKQTTPVSFRVSLALPSQPSGWVTGRLTAPSVQFGNEQTNPDLPYQVTVAGGSVTTPAVSASYFQDNSADFDMWNKLAGQFTGMDWSPNSMGTALSPTDIDRFLAMAAIDPNINKATFQTDEWVSNLSWAPSQPAGVGCAAPSGFAGFVGSNALVFSSAVPTFNPSTGSLDYRIAAPHRLPDGTVLSGKYSLLLDEAYAKCIWGVTGSIGTPTVTVTDSDPTVTPPTVNFVNTNGFVQIDVSGFNFSNVHIATKFGVVKKTVKTTKCMFKKNHKKTKTVKGSKCPTGWVKKK